MSTSGFRDRPETACYTKKSISQRIFVKWYRFLRLIEARGQSFRLLESAGFDRFARYTVLTELGTREQGTINR